MGANRQGRNGARAAATGLLADRGRARGRGPVHALSEGDGRGALRHQRLPRRAQSQQRRRRDGAAGAAPQI